ELPQDYYTILRFIVCGMSIFGFCLSLQFKKIIWIWLFATFSVLFNPIVPIGLERDTWVIIDVFVATILFISLFFFRLKKVNRKLIVKILNIAFIIVFILIGVICLFSYFESKQSNMSMLPIRTVPVIPIKRIQPIKRVSTIPILPIKPVETWQEKMDELDSLYDTIYDYSDIINR
ncbi:hypothetical protein MUP95_09375, partial [bacterium]|nr:hypothetical protein [bacterium]